MKIEKKSLAQQIINEMKKNFFLIMIALGFFSCQKEISGEGSNIQHQYQFTGRCLCGGYVSDYARYDDIGYPTYWKNGNPVKIDSDLPNSDYGYVGGRAVSIAVSGTDVFVSGSGKSVGPYRESIGALFWRNNIRELFNENELTSLKVSNSDIYVVGFRSGYGGLAIPLHTTRMEIL
jgi:hypothetical protein